MLGTKFYMPFKKGNKLGEKFQKGHIPYNKGKHHKEETKRKIGIANKGKTPTLGIKLSEEHKQKLRLSNIGNKYWIGRKHSKKTKLKMSIIHLNMTKATKLKMKRSWTKIRKQKQRKIMKILRQTMIIPFKDTKPERMIQLALTLKRIKFKKHKLIKKDNFYHQVDIFIEPNICIEIDGCYWHGCTDCFKYRKLNNLQVKNIQNDIRINHELNKLGYNIIRIWEHDILDNSNLITMNILNLIQNKSLKYDKSYHKINGDELIFQK